MPNSGVIGTTTPANGHCTGTIDGNKIDSATAIGFRGTYGDGPLSQASGGATCTHNDGTMRVTITQKDGASLIGQAYWIRTAALLIDGTGTLSGGPSVVTGAVTNRHGGDCFKGITTVDVDLVISATGDLSAGAGH